MKNPSENVPRCFYFVKRQCAYYGDSDDTCDVSGNPEHDGYCPMRYDDELLAIADEYVKKMEGKKKH